MHITRSISPSVVAAILVASFVLPALAVDEPVRGQQPEQRMQQRAEKQAQRGEKRQSALQRLDEKRQKLIHSFFERMAKRFEAAFERLRQIGERIQSRINRAKERGKDVAKAQAALDRARAAWREAKTALAEARVKFGQAGSATDPRVAFREARAILDSVKDKIKAAHAAMVEAVTALKGIGAGDDHATSTPPAVPTPQAQ